jgi:hypothetical protein
VSVVWESVGTRYLGREVSRLGAGKCRSWFAWRSLLGARFGFGFGGEGGCKELSQGSEVRCRCYLVLRELGGFRQ